MKEGYRFLGEYIRQVDIRNKEGKKENLLGVSVQKQFIQSIANTVGTDFTKYKVVKKGQFTYIPDTSRRGDKIAIALLVVFEELVSHGVAHLCIFPAGLCPEIGTAAGRTGTQYVPYFQVWQVGIVYYIPVKDGHE